ncbi:MAG: hypothetical protein ACI93T_002695 [Porticoccaceae bacterium]|jgi:hypothetical protein
MTSNTLIIICVTVQVGCGAMDVLMLKRHKITLHDKLESLWVKLADMRIGDIAKLSAEIVLAAKNRALASPRFPHAVSPLQHFSAVR